jgi:hypothetical protein
VDHLGSTPTPQNCCIQSFWSGEPPEPCIFLRGGVIVAADQVIWTVNGPLPHLVLGDHCTAPSVKQVPHPPPPPVSERPPQESFSSSAHIDLTVSELCVHCNRFSVKLVSHCTILKPFQKSCRYGKGLMPDSLLEQTPYLLTAKFAGPLRNKFSKVLSNMKNGV